MSMLTAVSRTQTRPHPPSLFACIALMASSFVAPRRRSTGSADGGRAKWNVGDRLWDMHVHAPKLLNRNLAAVQEQTEDGRVLTNAASLGLRQPEVVFDLQPFAGEVLRPDRSEIVNRPHIGLSMLVGTLHGLHVNLDESAQLGFVGKEFANNFKAMYTKYDLHHADRMLNVQDYPHAERTEAEIARAVKNVLKMGTEVAAQWRCYSDFFARTATNYVGIHALLTQAALVVPGRFAEGVKDVPLQGESAVAARKTLVENPAQSSAISAFLTNLVWGRVQAESRKAVAAMPAGSSPRAAVDTITFTPSPGEKLTAAEKRAFRAQVAEFRILAQRPGMTWAIVKEKAQALQCAYVEVGAKDPTLADEVVNCDIKSMSLEHKETLKRDSESSSHAVPEASPAQRKKSTAGAVRVEAKAFLAIDINGTPEETIENMAAKLSAKFAAMCESDPKLAKEIVDFDIAAKMKEYKKAKRHADSEAAATLTDAAPDSRGRATKRSAESTAAAHRPVRARRVERPSL